jgi:hypothetical protein
MQTLEQKLQERVVSVIGMFQQLRHSRLCFMMTPLRFMPTH